jgi:hypothetical protein
MLPLKASQAKNPLAGSSSYILPTAPDVTISVDLKSRSLSICNHREGHGFSRANTPCHQNKPLQPLMYSLR